MKSVILVTTIALLLVASTAIIVKPGNTTAKPIDPPRPTYIARPPIFIEGDANFTGPNGVTGGTGAIGDPYIIDGWDINVSGGGAAIMINNTNAYFVIRNCYAHDALGYLLYLFHATNGTIENCTFSNGLYIQIRMYSDNIFLINNTIFNMNFIEVDTSSNYFTMINNVITNVTHGVRIWYSSGAIFWNNTFINSGIRIEGNVWTYNTASIPLNNTVNGRPIYYYKNSSSLTLDETLNAGQIILFNCPFSNIKNITIVNASVGIEVAYSDWINILNSTFDNCGQGLYIKDSDYLNVDEVNSSNNVYGIEIAWVYNSTFSNSSFNSNLGFGIYSTYRSGDNIFSNCSFDLNGDSGVSIAESERSGFSNISANFNAVDGIVLFNSQTTGQNDFKDITTNNNSNGFHIEYSENNMITNLTSNNNSYCGILFEGYGSNNNSISISKIIGNLKGVYLQRGDNNTLQNCEISNCTQGVVIETAQNNTITDCTVKDNTMGLSLISTSFNNLIEGNIITNCSGFTWFYNNSTFSNEVVYQNDANWDNYTSFWEQLATGQLGSEPLYTKQVNVSNATRFFTHIIGQSDVVDLDLGIFLDGYDGNPIDGITQAGEIVGVCADFDADEEVTLDFPANGAYLIRVFGFDVTGNPGHFNMTVEVSSENSTGILCQNSTTCTILDNNITNSTVGMHMDALSVGNRIYHNNFIANSVHAIDKGNNIWDNGFPSGGNHWDNWTAPDGNRDGFVDIPLIVGPVGKDNYPFAQPWSVDTTPPIAEAGSNITISQGQNATFNGSASSDDVGIANYTWNFTYGGNLLVLYGMYANFTFYLVGNYFVNLTVRDAAGLSSTDRTWVNVQDVPDPIANAGPDQAIDQGTSAVLNGSGSTSTLALVNYTWSFTYNGTVQTLYGMEVNFTFYMPGNYSVNLTVRDIAGDAGMDQVWINVRDTTPPFADAGHNQTIGQGESATFNGSGSFDNVGITNYTWTFIYNGTSQNLYGEAASFTFYTVGNYSVNLTVRDLAGNFNTDSLWVNVRDTVAPMVISVSPTGVDVAVGGTIMIVFSEAMDRASVEGAITISPGIGTPTYAWSDDNETVNVSSSSNFAHDTPYNVTIGTGAKDVSGNNLTSAFIWSFTTEKETVVQPPSEPPYYLIVALAAIIATVAIVVVLWARKRKPKNEGESPPTEQSL